MLSDEQNIIFKQLNADLHICGRWLTPKKKRVIIIIIIQVITGEFDELHFGLSVCLLNASVVVRKHVK